VSNPGRCARADQQRGDVASLLRQIEQHYLRNPDENLYFALLTDFGDADEQYLPGDAGLLEQQQRGASSG
jgi:hypothetical protein